jgi:hypothetical protein
MWCREGFERRNPCREGRVRGFCVGREGFERRNPCREGRVRGFCVGREGGF